MKLSFEKQALLSAISIVMKAVPSRTTMPILECILIGPALLLIYCLSPQTSPMPQALGASFACSLIFFSLYHTFLEWREMRGME